MTKLVLDAHQLTKKKASKKPSEQDALQAVKTLIAWVGEDPDRDGLIDTPKRVLAAYKEFTEGYSINPKTILNKTFKESKTYTDMVLVKNIHFCSHCEHHLLPIIGKAHIAYYPTNQIVGLSKLARLVDVYAKRLQTQERLTLQIADALFENLDTSAVAVYIQATHHCMSIRGTHQQKNQTVTQQFRGNFENQTLKQEFLNSL